MSSRSLPVSPERRLWWFAVASLAIGGHFATATLQTWLGQPDFATSLISPTSYQAVLQAWQVPGEQVGDTILYNIPWSLPATLVLSGLAIIGSLGSLWTWWATPPGRRQPAIARWLFTVGCGALAVGLWDWVWLFAVLTAGDAGATLLAALIPFWLAVVIAAVITAGSGQWAEHRGQSRDSETPSNWRKDWRLAALIAVYVVVFTTMNWRLWFNLLLPHGDSAMYEEHLWNLLHGKGFRSYLDQGLFLGEHIQFVHLGLIPLYLLWPSHLLLEFCESLALGCGAMPVAWLTLRHTGSRSAALGAAAAYLLYTPMQFLDIEIDLKTFRPEAFGIPILLFTLDQLDRGRWRGFLLGVLGCLTVKEDYALVLSPLGLWIAGTAWKAPESSSASVQGRRWLWIGCGLCLFGVFYLWLATRVLMPWFRTGAEIHYASYFTRLGDSPEAIVRTVLTRPGYVVGLLLNLSTLLYALALLVPVGGLACLSPGRLAVGLPLFGILCLNELARDPRHQFHAPLVAIIFWATAVGLSRFPDLCDWLRKRWQQTREANAGPSRPALLTLGSRWLWTSSLATGFFFSLSPLGLSFWDPGSSWNGWKLYGPGPRGAAFATIAPLILPTARVASTDFIHPRFTHHARSYDYSDYARKVSGYEHRVPDDTDFIVIDTGHPYSRYKIPDDVPEYHDRQHWKLVPGVSGGMFIVLQRVHRKTGKSQDDRTTGSGESRAGQP